MKEDKKKIDEEASRIYDIVDNNNYVTTMATMNISNSFSSANLFLMKIDGNEKYKNILKQWIKDKRFRKLIKNTRYYSNRIKFNNYH